MAVLSAPVLAAFVLLLMSVDNPFSIACSAIMLASQVPMVRWILSLDTQRARRARIRGQAPVSIQDW